MFGADQSLMDKMGKTAKDLAIESENVGYLNALDMFENLAEDAMITGEKKRLQATVNRKYTFEIIPRCTGEGLVPPDDLMPVHEPNLERKAVMPRHMDVYEDELKPMLVSCTIHFNFVRNGKWKNVRIWCSLVPNALHD
jgi:hypothetical protein